MKLEEVARLAGVSRSTVSRVINDDRRVSDDARRRVQDVIREHDYHPNAAARSLASRRTRILGLLIPQPSASVFGDPFFARLIEGATEVCNASDNNLMMLINANGDEAAMDRLYRRVIRGRHLDGVIIASSVVDDKIVERLRRDRYPFVLVGRHPKYREISFVDVDNHGAARDAVAHLLDHGYRRVATIVGTSAMIATIDRYGGYVSALREAGMLPEPSLAISGDFTQLGGYKAMEALLPERPEAVFAASDSMAIGAVQAVQSAGLRVPEDVAVMGFDGLPVTASMRPPISTVTQPVAELGCEAVRQLIRLIERPDSGPEQRFLPTALVLRRSCGCAGDGAIRGRV